MTRLLGFSILAIGRVLASEKWPRRFAALCYLSFHPRELGQFGALA